MVGLHHRACDPRVVMTPPPTTYRIAVIAGDGIGTEVIPAGIDVLQQAVRGEPCVLEFTEFPWGCEYYQRTGTMMSEDAVATRPDIESKFAANAT